MNKQCKRVVEYMQQHGSITGVEAKENLGCIRLASRINDLKNAGWEFNRVFETGPNRFGEPTHWARYSIKNPPSALVQPTAEEAETANETIPC